jgi:hypothetical protein
MDEFEQALARVKQKQVSAEPIDEFELALQRVKQKQLKTPGYQAATMGAMQGATLGAAPHMIAAARMAGPEPGRAAMDALSFGATKSMPRSTERAPDSYSQSLAQARQEFTQAREDSPWSYYGGAVPGAVMSGMAMPFKAPIVAAEAGLLARAGSAAAFGAKTGAVQGGVQAGFESVHNPLESPHGFAGDVGVGTALGGAVGGGLGGVGAAAAPAIARVPAKIASAAASAREAIGDLGPVGMSAAQWIASKAFPGHGLAARVLLYTARKIARQSGRAEDDPEVLAQAMAEAQEATGVQAVRFGPHQEAPHRPDAADAWMQGSPQGDVGTTIMPGAQQRPITPTRRAPVDPRAETRPLEPMPAGAGFKRDTVVAPGGQPIRGVSPVRPPAPATQDEVATRVMSGAERGRPGPQFAPQQAGPADAPAPPASEGSAPISGLFVDSRAAPTPTEAPGPWSRINGFREDGADWNPPWMEPVPGLEEFVGPPGTTFNPKDEWAEAVAAFQARYGPQGKPVPEVAPDWRPYRLRDLAPHEDARMKWSFDLAGTPTRGNTAPARMRARGAGVDPNADTRVRPPVDMQPGAPVRVGSKVLPATPAEPGTQAGGSFWLGDATTRVRPVGSTVEEATSAQAMPPTPAALRQAQMQALEATEVIPPTASGAPHGPAKPEVLTGEVVPPAPEAPPAPPRPAPRSEFDEAMGGGAPEPPVRPVEESATRKAIDDSFDAAMGGSPRARYAPEVIEQKVSAARQRIFSGDYGRPLSRYQEMLRQRAMLAIPGLEADGRKVNYDAVEALMAYRVQAIVYGRDALGRFDSALRREQPSFRAFLADNTDDLIRRAASSDQRIVVDLRKFMRNPSKEAYDAIMARARRGGPATARLAQLALGVDPQFGPDMGGPR